MKDLPLFWLALTTIAALGSESERPHILLILTDDQGYGDLSLHGNPDLETPRLDALGRESLRFTNFLVHSVCAPTRASLLTGKHFTRVSVWGVHEGREHLIRSVQTLPEALRDAGYFTAMVGKWHLGINPGHRPWERGFQVALAGTNYRNQTAIYRMQSADGPVELRGRTTEDMLTREALQFIDQRPVDRPFFCYVAYNAPHHPWVGPEAMVRQYREKGLAEITARCYAEIESMDRAIGTLLDGLAERGLASETLVIFFSDNGPHQHPIPARDWERRNPHGFRGQKGHLYDNAHRVPLFVRMPGQSPREIPQLTTVADWMPTLLEIASVPETAWPAGLEGRSLVPLLGGNHPAWSERTLVDTAFNPTWDDSTNRREPDLSALEFDRQGLWIREGPYKLVQDRRGHLQLFDTLADPQESEDLRWRHPQRTARMHDQLRRWWAETLTFPETFEKADLIIGHRGEALTTFKPVTFPEWRGDVGGWYRFEDMDQPGDGFAGKVSVETPGRYRVSLHGSHQGDSIAFQLRIGDATLETQVPLQPGDIPLGTIELKEQGEFPFELTLITGSEGRLPHLYLMHLERLD